ncbi:MAG: hypothetical protein R6V86_01450 [Spirochaetia bacterium]
MKIELNAELIGDFREKVNGNLNFVYNQYHDKDGKNNWHLICSCMDWITVAVRYLNKIPRFSDDIDIKVIQVYSIISSIDIVYEAVSQLHRVFKNTKKPPFDGDDEIFKRDQFDKDDNEYFKEIRSCFGAHPVNLKKDNSARRYASWPFEPFTDADSLLEVRLYDGNVGVDDTHFGLRKNELIQFLLSRYNYLGELIVEIERQFQEYSKKIASKAIRHSSTITEELEILKEESKIRFNNDYYNQTITELIRIFGATCKEDHLIPEEVSFKERLNPLVAEIRTNLQKAELKDLSHDSALNPEWFRSAVQYELSKFLVWMEGHSDDALFPYYFKRLNEFSRNHYALSLDESIDVTFLKTKLLLQRINEFS